MENEDIVIENRRLYILKTLKVSANYRMSDILLQAALKNMGYGASLAVLRADLAWLKDLRLLSTELLGGMVIALLRNEGVDVADGTSVVPGIAKPLPE